MFLLILALALGFAAAAGSVTFRALRGQPVVLRLVGLVGAFWTAAVSLYAACIAVFFVAVAEPWPLSLRQGPDTDYARERFAHHFQEPPPGSVGELYGREEWGFGGDSIHSLRFDFRDPRVIERLVERLGLEPVPHGELANLRYLPAPDWWPAEPVLKNSNEAYQRSGVDFLWVDRDTGRAYFQRANF